MLGRLLPRAKVDFFALFSQHAGLTRDAALLLRDLLDDLSRAEEQSNRIRALEHEADALCQQAMESLHRTFVTPIERTDLHALASRLDDITDHVESAAQRLWLYEIRSVTPEAREMVEHLCRATDAVRETVDALSGRRDGDRIRLLCRAVKEVEKQNDRLLRRATAKLFHEEQDAKTLIKWKEIYESLEEAIDGCEDVANVIEGVVLENA
jgi:predicted phosphate transport protein (TIGR00153 family)